MKKYTIKVGFLLISLGVGLGFGMIGEVLYRLMRGATNGVITSSVYMTGLLLAIGTALFIRGMWNRSFDSTGIALAVFLGGAAVFFGLSVLGDYLYELEPQPEPVMIEEATEPPTEEFVTRQVDFNYGFMIDDSSSMGSNDPDDARYEAITEIITNMTPTRNFAVYSFGNGIIEVNLPFGSKNSSDVTVEDVDKDRYYGGTDMVEAISSMIDSMQTVATNGNKTKIIVLTDGQIEPGGINDLINKATQNDTAISAVGFGGTAKDNMEPLTNGTGGMFVDAENVENLTASLQSVMETIEQERETVPEEEFEEEEEEEPYVDQSRNIVGTRNGDKHMNGLYIFLRIIILIVLGAAITAYKFFLTGNNRFPMVTIIPSAIGCFLASLLMEFGLLPMVIDSFTLTEPLPAMLPRIFSCVLWSVTVIPQPVYRALGSDLLGGGTYQPIGNTAAGKTYQNGTNSAPDGTKTFI